MAEFSNIARRILGSMAVTLLLTSVTAQSPDIQKISVAVPAGEPIFSRSLQDQNGYLWLGSDKGLFRFDGISLRQYYPDPDSSDFRISALYEDKAGIIWIGSRNGNIYRLENEVVSILNPGEGMPGTAVSDFITDNNGTLWWSTTGEGIYYLENGHVFNINYDNGLNDNYVYDLELDQEGNIWAGTDGGVAICIPGQDEKKVKSLSADIPLPDIIARVIRKGPDNIMWLGFEDGGIACILPGTDEVITFYDEARWPFGAVHDMAVLEGLTWVATASGDVVEINPGSTTHRVRPVTTGHQAFGRINDLLEDREGNIWILANSGLFRSTGNRIRFLRDASGILLENIHAIRNDDMDPRRLWFSNDKGLFQLNLADGSTKRYLENFSMPDLKIMCLYQDQHGNLWAGTFNYGVFRIRPADGSWIQVTDRDGLVNNNVLSISGHDDTLWMATLGGASEVILNGSSAGRPFTINSHNRETGLVSNFIYSVYEDIYDQIWFATDGDGISVRTKKGWISYDEMNGLTDDVIYSITADKYGSIWIASASKGIFKYSDGKFTPFGINEGLSSLDITGLVTTGEEVVIVNDNGLDVFHIPTGRIAHYGEELGLSGISPDLNVVSKDLYGHTWIGTRKGIMIYRQGSGTTSYGPETVMEKMSVYLEPVSMEENLILGYNQNHVSFNYAGLWFSNPGKVTYQVMLEGYDLGWKNTFDRQATYSSLPPGKYTFKVRSSLSQSFRNASEVSYHFRIRGPIWQSYWFILLILLVVTGITWYIIRFREKRLRRIEQQKKEKVEFEFQVLKNQVNPHFLFNSFSTLMSLIEEDPGQALQYTEKLSDFFRTILQYKDQEVIRLDEEISLIESYFFLLKKRYGDNLHLDISPGKDLGKMFIPPMTLQILMENAVKHNIISKDKPLFIRIIIEERNIMVENNYQPKMVSEVSTGIGLENVRKRYKMITEAEPLIEKNDEVFRVILPVIR